MDLSVPFAPDKTERPGQGKKMDSLIEQVNESVSPLICSADAVRRRFNTGRS